MTHPIYNLVLLEGRRRNLSPLQLERGHHLLSVYLFLLLLHSLTLALRHSGRKTHNFRH